MPNIIFVDAKWDGKIELGKKLIGYINKNKVKSVALFASVQFLNLNEVFNQLKKLDIEVKTTKAKRTDKEIQILGCDIYHDSFDRKIIEESDLILYIGDGMFHPKALLLSQIKNKQIKPVVIWNPISGEMKILTEKTIQKQLNKIKSNIKRYIMAKKIGILVKKIKNGDYKKMESE